MHIVLLQKLKRMITHVLPMNLVLLSNLVTQCAYVLIKLVNLILSYVSKYKCIYFVFINIQLISELNKFNTNGKFKAKSERQQGSLATIE